MATGPRQDSRAITRWQLESAVQLEQFELHYQPMIDTRDRWLHGVEALVRWNHPERGLLRPAEFIPQAEETGAIVALGAWVLRQACSEFRLLRPKGRDLLLSVNVSAAQLERPEFLASLADVLEETRMPARLLQLEITESIFLGDSMRMGALLQGIRGMGVRIAFDDFGTGYSSLSYLERFPVDLLKVDQYFVQRLGKGLVNAEIVQLIVHIARAIGMNVSAEGVETVDQAAALSQLGCHISQGYLFSRPLPLNAIVKMLQEETREAERKGVQQELELGWVSLLSEGAGG